MKGIKMNERKEISVVEYDKRVEIEAANLMYFEYMDKKEAFSKAKEYVNTKFTVKRLEMKNK
jgi:hypothetical protein